MNTSLKDAIKLNGIDFVLTQVLTTYIINGNFNVVEALYKRDKATMINMINRYKERCEANHSALYTAYKEKAREVKLQRDFNPKQGKRNIQDILRNYKTDAVEYKLLLNDIFNCNTGSMTGNDIVREANKLGLAVIDDFGNIINV